MTLESDLLMQIIKLNFVLKEESWQNSLQFGKKEESLKHLTNSNYLYNKS